MTGIVGRLMVKLGLETAAFETGTKRAIAQSEALGGKAEAMGRKVGLAGKAMLAAGAALAGSAVFGAVQNLVENSMRLAENVKKSAEIAGAGVEEFQRAAFAAKTVGIESEKLADIYKDVNDKIGEFLQTGGGEMKDFFDNIAPKVGITAEAFRNLSGPEALQLYVSSLEKAGVSQKEMTFYLEAIADEASALAPLLRNGGKAFDELASSADRLGVVLSPEQIKRIGEAGQKYNDLKTVLSARIAGIVADNATEILGLVEALSELITKAGQAARAWQNWRREVANRQDQQIVDGWFTSDQAKRDARGRIITRNIGSGLQRDASGRIDGSLEMPDGAGSSGGAFRNFQTRPVNPKLLGPTSGALRANFAGTGLGGGNGLTGFAPGGKTDGWAMVQNDLANTDRWVQKLEDSESELIETTQQMKGVAKETAGSMQRDFVNSVQGITGALSNLENSIRGGGFLSILSSVIGLGLQLGGAGLFGSKLQSRLRGSTPSIPGYAGGTSWHPGGLAMVGEKGPEIVNLPQGSKVWPNGTGPGGAGGAMQLRVVPSAYFDVIVDSRIDAKAPAIASAGARAGMARGQAMQRRTIGA